MAKKPYIKTDANGTIIPLDLEAETLGGKTLSQIENEIPAKTSDLQNDSGFITQSDIPSIPSKTSDLQNDSGFITNSNAQIGESQVTNLPTDLQNIREVAEGKTKTYVIDAQSDITGTKNSDDEYTNVTAITGVTIANLKVGDNVLIKALNVPDYWISQLNKSGGVTTSVSLNKLETTKVIVPTVNNATLTIQKNGTTIATFTANSSTNQTANISVPTALSDLTQSASYRTVTDTEKSTWNGKQDAGNYATSIRLSGSNSNQIVIGGSNGTEIGRVTPNDTSKLPLAGGTMTGKLYLTAPLASPGGNDPTLSINYSSTYVDLGDKGINMIKFGNTDNYIGQAPANKSDKNIPSFAFHTSMTDTASEFGWFSSSWTKRMALGTSGLRVYGGFTCSGRVLGAGDDEGIVVTTCSNGYAGITLGNPSNTNEGTTLYYNHNENKAYWRFKNGAIYHPEKGGTVALTSDIPINSPITFNKTLTLSTAYAWVTAFGVGDVDASGIYTIDVFVSTSSPFWSSHFVGILNWYADGTNANEADEIYMQGGGHAMNHDIHLYGRTLKRAGSDGGSTVFQLSCNRGVSQATYQFKLTKIGNLV